jgi:hypothetical protein
MSAPSEHLQIEQALEATLDYIPLQAGVVLNISRHPQTSWCIVYVLSGKLLCDA